MNPLMTAVNNLTQLYSALSEFPEPIKTSQVSRAEFQLWAEAKQAAVKEVLEACTQPSVAPGILLLRARVILSLTDLPTLASTKVIFSDAARKLNTAISKAWAKRDPQGWIDSLPPTAFLDTRRSLPTVISFSKSFPVAGSKVID